MTVSRILYYVCTYAYARFQSLLPSIIYDGRAARCGIICLVLRLSAMIVRVLYREWGALEFPPSLNIPPPPRKLKICVVS